MIVGDTAIWTREPLVSEIKQGSGPDGLPPAFFRVLAYRTDDPNTGHMSWTSMPAGNLTMYILPSNDNPFDTTKFGTMQSYNISREVASWGANANVLLMLLLTLAGLILM